MNSRTSAIGRIPHALRLIDCPVGRTPIAPQPALTSWQLEGVAMLAEVPELEPLAKELAERLPGHDSDRGCGREMQLLKARAGELFNEYLEASLRLVHDLDIESDNSALRTYHLVQRDRVRKGLAQLSRITQLASDARHLLGSAVLLQRCFTHQSYGYFVAELQALKDDARALASEITYSQKRSANAAAA
jgi:hypothetical protein